MKISVKYPFRSPNIHFSIYFNGSSPDVLHPDCS